MGQLSTFAIPIICSVLIFLRSGVMFNRQHKLLFEFVFYTFAGKG